MKSSLWFLGSLIVLLFVWNTALSKWAGDSARQLTTAEDKLTSTERRLDATRKELDRLEAVLARGHYITVQTPAEKQTFDHGRDVYARKFWTDLPDPSRSVSMLYSPTTNLQQALNYAHEVKVCDQSDDEKQCYEKAWNHFAIH